MFQRLRCMGELSLYSPSKTLPVTSFRQNEFYESIKQKVYLPSGIKLIFFVKVNIVRNNLLEGKDEHIQDTLKMS